MGCTGYASGPIAIVWQPRRGPCHMSDRVQWTHVGQPRFVEMLRLFYSNSVANSVTSNLAPIWEKELGLAFEADMANEIEKSVSSSCHLASSKGIMGPSTASLTLFSRAV